MPGSGGGRRMSDVAMALSATPLTDRFTCLEPLTEALRESLRAAISGDDPVWDIMASSARGERFDGWWRTALGDMRTGSRVAYAVRRLADDEIVGATSFLHIDPANRGVEIGSTFLHAQARSGPVNPDMKLAMLAHAFDSGVARVEIRTDERNLRSQAAIAKLGAVREGVLRKHKVLWNGEMRATVIFSIIDEDWPPVSRVLQARLDAFAAP